MGGGGWRRERKLSYVSKEYVFMLFSIFYDWLLKGWGRLEKRIKLSTITLTKKIINFNVVCLFCFVAAGGEGVMKWCVVIVEEGEVPL